MAEQEYAGDETDRGRRGGAGDRTRWRWWSGVLTLGMAVAAFTGHLPVLNFDPRWLLAGAAAVVGALLLLGSLRRR